MLTRYAKMKPKTNSLSKVQEFFNQKFNQKIEPPNTPPKFAIGDYIINTKYKVISKVIDIKDIFENEDRTINYQVAQYILQDVKNEARDKFLLGMGARLTTQDWNGAVKPHKRYKFVRAIDATYHKMNPDVAQALYSSRAQTGDENAD